MITWFKRNLVLISTSKFFKDNKTAWAHRASAICSLWKIYKCVLYQIAWEIMLSLVNNIHEKTSKRVKTDVTFDSADMLFVICNRVTTLHSCYNFALLLQFCTCITWESTSFQPIRHAQICHCIISWLKPHYPYNYCNHDPVA